MAQENKRVEPEVNMPEADEAEGKKVDLKDLSVEDLVPGLEEEIARMEGESILRAMVERIDTLAIVGEVRPRLNNSLRGLDVLPLEVTAT